MSALTAWAQGWADRSPRSYALIWVVFWNTCSVYQFFIMYGWNIWVDQIFYSFYGNEPRTMARGAPVFALSCIMLFYGCVNSFIIGPFKLASKETKIRLGKYEMSCGPRKCYIVGTILMLLGTILLGIAIRYKSIALLVIASGPFFGIGAGLTQSVIRVVPMMFFTAVGMRGLGAGISGCLPGILAASFSYWGLAISDAIGIEDCCFVVMGIMAVLSVIPLPFINVVAPSNLNLDAKKKESNAPDAVEITFRQMNRTSQFWLFLIVMFLVFTPAFGIKYLVSPMLHDVFQAKQADQQLASFLFLFIYAAVRFFTGVFDHWFKPLSLFRVVLVVSVPAYMVCGVLSYHYSSRAAMWGFVACQSVIGAGLGAVKVLYFLILFDIYGPINFSLSSISTLWCFGLAGFVGPMLGWWALCAEGGTITTATTSQSGSYQHDLSASVAMYNYISGGACALALLISYCITKIDFSKFSKEKNNDEEEHLITERNAVMAGEEDSEIDTSKYDLQIKGATSG